MQRKTLQVDGMSCQHCVTSIEKAVQEIGGAAKVDLESNSVTVEYDASKVSLEAIKEAIEEQGYEVAQ